MDAGEAEASAPGRGRQMASTKSRSSKEPPRNERTTEGATKPVSEEEGIQRTEGRAGPRWGTGGPPAGLSLTSTHCREKVSPQHWRMRVLGASTVSGIWRPSLGLTFARH